MKTLQDAIDEVNEVAPELGTKASKIFMQGHELAQRLLQALALEQCITDEETWNNLLEFEADTLLLGERSSRYFEELMQLLRSHLPAHT